MALKDIAVAGLGLVLLGSVSTRFGAGEGLRTLGAGVQSIVAAPGTGFGLGLQGTALGIRSIGESIGDIGRGFGELFKWLPEFDEYKGSAGSSGRLIPESGGSGSDLESGGGGNIPRGPMSPEGIYPVTGIGPGITWTFEGAPTYWQTEAAAMKNYARTMEQGINNV